MCTFIYKYVFLYLPEFLWKFNVNSVSHENEQMYSYYTYNTDVKLIRYVILYMFNEYGEKREEIK